MTCVTITSRRFVQCADDTAINKLGSSFHLGVIDMRAFPLINNEVIFVYKKPGLGAGNFIPAHRLEQAFSRVLDYYPHLTGRFEKISAEKGYKITQFNKGADFVEAECPLQLDEVAALDKKGGRVVLTNLPEDGLVFMPTVELSFDAFLQRPVMGIQHTRLGCGSVVIGLRINHMVCDAAGFFQFARHLAETYRAFSGSVITTGPSKFALCCPPVIKPYLSSRSELSLQEQKAAAEYKQKSWFCEEQQKEGGGNVSAIPPMKSCGRVLRFSADDLTELKNAACDPSGSGWISTFEAICAYLAQTVYKARLRLYQDHGVSEVAAVQEISRGFWAPIEVRGSSGLDLAEEYFGNAIFFVYSYMPHELLGTGSLWQVAKYIHELVRSPTKEEIVQTTRWLLMQADNSRIKPNYEFGKGSFTVTQWSKFKMYSGVELGGEGDAVWPVLVSPVISPLHRVDGFAKMLSTEEDLRVETGGLAAIDVVLTLGEALWKYLEEDPMFERVCR